MNYENIIKKTKEIETLLVSMGADGRGLHEKVSSIENLLDKEIVKAIRFIATIRNKLLHEDSFELTQTIHDQFNDTYCFIMDNVSSNIHEEVYTQDNNSKSSNYNSNSDYSELKRVWDELSGWQKVGVGTVGLIGAAVVTWFNNL